MDVFFFFFCRSPSSVLGTTGSPPSITLDPPHEQHKSRVRTRRDRHYKPFLFDFRLTSEPVWRGSRVSRASRPAKRDVVDGFRLIRNLTSSPYARDPMTSAAVFALFAVVSGGHLLWPTAVTTADRQHVRTVAKRTTTTNGKYTRDDCVRIWGAA